MTCNTVVTSANVARDCATWSKDEQERWRLLFDPAFNRRPPWARQTQYQNAGVYTRLLECARRHGHVPEVSPDAIRAFVAEAEKAGRRISTISGYLWAIWKVLRKVHGHPSCDLDWFYETCKNFDQAVKRTARQGAARKVDTAELSLAGEKLILEARKMAERADRDNGCDAFELDEVERPNAVDPSTTQIPWKAVQSFRDGLFLLVGAYGPERLRALADIRIGQLDPSNDLILFEPHQIKMKRASPRLLPGPVFALLQEWLEFWRPHYAGDHDGVWIAKGGGIPCNAAMYAAMKKATKLTIGSEVTPHQLRDAAATLVVEDSPEIARLASIVLDHRDVRMTRAYTHQAHQIAAGRALARAIERQAEATERKVRAVSRSTIALNPRSRRLTAVRPSVRG